MEIFLFYKTLILLLGTLCVTVRNPVHAVLILVGIFLTIASLLHNLDFTFLAFMLFMVYLGGITVLLLFVVMMIQYHDQPMVLNSSSFVIYAFLAMLVFNYEPSMDLGFGNFKVHTTNIYLLNDGSDLEVLGQTLFTLTWLPFTLTGFILFVAIIGGVALTLANAKGLRRQQTFLQITQTHNLFATN
jgi:NADH-quinone oxidoreductase subunit J